ncbi:MAG: hypothetical protein Q7T35_03445 [Nitrosomonas sp.]|nr:hypothetical protein [Nitrosomonas sp.]
MKVINLSSLDGNNGFRLDGLAADDRTGFSVSDAGDVNGDGFDDLIIGAPGIAYGAELGSGYVVFGKSAGFNGTLELSSLNGDDGFRLHGNYNFYNELLGHAVSSAGDVNGDGFDDFMIGAPQANDYEGDSAGACYVVFGRASGFTSALNLSMLDTSSGFSVSRHYGSEIGRVISNAGDVNGDGFDDLIFSEYMAGMETTFSGPRFVVFGKAEGVPDQSVRFSVSEYASWGGTVSGAGDVNGDGIDDLIMGANSVYAGGGVGFIGGGGFVVFGKTGDFSSMALADVDGNNGFLVTGAGVFVNNAGDVNGDGFGDVIVGDRVVFGKASGFSAEVDISDLDGVAGFRLEGAVEGLVSSAGDVNGDGFDDLLIGGSDVKGDGSGSSYVVYGKASGFGAILDLSNLDERAGFRLDGVAAGDGSGQAVSGIGDINNDGFDDLIIGAPGADPNGADSGSSYVVFGGDFTDDEVILGTSGNDKLIGTAAAERFEAGSGNDRIIGRGGADVFHGDAGNDYMRIRDLNFQQVAGGSGKDTLGLGGSGLNLDLSSAGNKIGGIEIIYLYGTGDNTLTLSAEDVLNLSDSTDTLKVNGNAGDRIVGLSNGWEDGGIDGDFHTYTNDAAVLLVGLNVETDFPVI